MYYLVKNLIKTLVLGKGYKQMLMGAEHVKHIFIHIDNCEYIPKHMKIRVYDHKAYDHHMNEIDRQKILNNKIEKYFVNNFEYIGSHHFSFSNSNFALYWQQIIVNSSSNTQIIDKLKNDNELLKKENNKLIKKLKQIENVINNKFD